MANSNSMVSEQDGLVFDLASKSLNFCPFSLWFFHFFIVFVQLWLCTLPMRS